MTGPEVWTQRVVRYRVGQRGGANKDLGISLDREHTPSGPIEPEGGREKWRIHTQKNSSQMFVAASSEAVRLPAETRVASVGMLFVGANGGAAFPQQRYEPQRYALRKKMKNTSAPENENTSRAARAFGA